MRVVRTPDRNQIMSTSLNDTRKMFSAQLKLTTYSNQPIFISNIFKLLSEQFYLPIALYHS